MSLGDTDVINDIIQALGTVVGVIVAVLIFKLERRLSFRDKLAHREAVQLQVDKLLRRISEGERRKVYPHNNEENRYGFTYQGAELKGYSYDGVEFFNSIQEAYYDQAGEITLKETEKKVRFPLYETGVIPYKWIEHVDIMGDDTSYRPQFYTHFNGTVGNRGKYRVPYKTHRYFKRNQRFDKKTNPYEMEFIEVKVTR
jgi:hypothetical protein